MRTHLATLAASLTVDNCQWRIDVPLWQVSLPEQTRLEPHFTEQHLKIAYNNCHFSLAKVKKHRLFDVTTRSVAPLLTTSVRRALGRT
jgi:hypothetical protein